MPKERLAYFFFRLNLGVNIALHGGVRIGAGVGNFADGMVREFQATPLPAGLVHLFAVVLPFLETGLGICLTLGLRTRCALLVLSGLMVCLVLGTALRSDYNNLAIQLLYGFVCYTLLRDLDHNAWALDLALSPRPR
jgi:thiosulfate dehydrogenase [quinone] large subunit